MLLPKDAVGMHTVCTSYARELREMVVMVILVWTALIVGLVYFTYGAGRELLSRVTDHPSGVQRIPVADTGSGSDDGPERVAEAREAELSRQLVSGHLDPGAYQQAMTELAQSGPDRLGDPR